MWRPRSRTPFQLFAEAHEGNNRYEATLTLARHLAVNAIVGSARDEPVTALFPKRVKARRMDVLKRYKGPWSAARDRRQATIGDFARDLRNSWQPFYESILIRELSALELFIREWAWNAATAALLETRDETIRNRLNRLLNKTERPTPVNLADVDAAFPRLGRILASSPGTRRVTDVLDEVAVIDLSVASQYQMWKDVRNAIVHNDGFVSPYLSQQQSERWEAMHREAIREGHHIRFRPLDIGMPLPLVYRHVPFCLTCCFQTAVVLHTAWPLGTTPL